MWFRVIQTISGENKPKANAEDYVTDKPCVAVYNVL